jgi:hypothetical protein
MMAMNPSYISGLLNESLVKLVLGAKTSNLLRS